MSTRQVHAPLPTATADGTTQTPDSQDPVNILIFDE